MVSLTHPLDNELLKMPFAADGAPPAAPPMADKAAAVPPAPTGPTTGTKPMTAVAKNENPIRRSLVRIMESFPGLVKVSVRSRRPKSSWEPAF